MSPQFCGFAFQWLLLDHSKKVTLEENEIKGLVKEVEERLKRVVTDPIYAGDAVELLAVYYSRNKDEMNLMRVLNVLENSLKADERLISDVYMKKHNYQRIYDLYKKYSNFPKPKEAV